MSPAEDRRFQEMAVQLASESKQEKEPYLFVGAVIVKEGTVIARACRGQQAPGDHAEFTALEKELADEDKDFEGSTVYATLEPCSVRSPDKTPCVTRLIKRGVKRVVVGMVDPNIDIRGSGILELQRAGIEVQLFDPDLVAQLRELNRDFEKKFYTAPTRLARRIQAYTNQPTAEAACLEFLRLENIYGPWEDMPSIFGKARVMTDEAGERIGWDVLRIETSEENEFEAKRRQFADNRDRVMLERNLGRYYLAIVADTGMVASSSDLADEIVLYCMERKVGVKVLIGFLARGKFVPVVLTDA